jgi:hypothetical protein
MSNKLLESVLDTTAAGETLHFKAQAKLELWNFRTPTWQLILSTFRWFIPQLQTFNGLSYNFQKLAGLLKMQLWIDWTS